VRRGIEGARGRAAQHLVGPIEARVLAILIALVTGSAFADQPRPFCPIERTTDAITTAAGAMGAARSGWSSVFGKAGWHTAYSPDYIALHEPYQAILSDGRWYVSGRQLEGKSGPSAIICESNGAVMVTSSNP